jgi:hypothetical protein
VPGYIVIRLHVTLLRPEPPGNLITQGGDIDNRLKTLFDALSMPKHQNSLPPTASPAADQNPFFCLLGDDNLVTSVGVRTEQLLEPVDDSNCVDVLVSVKTSVTEKTMDNFVLD